MTWTQKLLSPSCFPRSILCSVFLKNRTLPSLVVYVLSLQGSHPVCEVTMTKAPRQVQLKCFILDRSCQILFCKANVTVGCIVVQWENTVCIQLLFCKANVIVSRPYKLPDVDNQLKCVSLTLETEENCKSWVGGWCLLDCSYFKYVSSHLRRVVDMRKIWW